MLDEKLVSEIVGRITAEYRSAGMAANIKKVPIGVSGRHIHLTREHLEALFGKGYTLTPDKELAQPGQFSCKESVTIVGVSMRPIEKVRVLGPLRSETQVEISRTDSYTLKLTAPVRPSGEIKGSAPITVIGPKGAVSLNEGCIIANRHIHMNAADAKRFNFKDGEMTAVRANGEKRTVFYDVQIRVSESFVLQMHIDTDDANAACLSNCDEVEIIPNE